ncbi:hypothetical protein [Terracoccus luteus]|uniref:Uncharacterized protein n=1 Tax=Terracoccus luteus TaxID=53356 RepID=A0A839Q2K1_9MICO|nr:hypothetical protein [Terracoccus luteus]MBB2988496.1 hypothetical protein [Terracoccus luteus]MCP2174157.1 hypothetical protein [Terracoccus luteus]
MNEIKPHWACALKTLQRADVFGVAAADVTFVDLLEASTPAGAEAESPAVTGEQVPA